MKKRLYIVAALIILPIAAFAQSAQNDSCSMADQLLMAEKHLKALPYLEACQIQNPSNKNRQMQLAACYDLLGMLPKAKAIYTILHTQDSTDQAVIKQLGNIHYSIADYQAASQYYLALVELDSANVSYYKLAAKALFLAGDLEEALMHYQVAHEFNRQDINTIYSLAVTYYQLKRNSSATKIIQRGLEQYPSHVKLALLGSKISFSENQYEETIEILEGLLTHHHDTTLQIKKMLGLSLYYIHQYQKALPLLHQIIKDDPDPDILHYYIGNIYHEQGQISEAKKHFALAIDEGISDNITVYYTKLGITMEETGNHPEAINAFKAAYQSSKDQTLLYHLARNYDIYYRDKQMALDYYQRYLAEKDSSHLEYINYSEMRASAIREMLHFTDTID